ncbi:pyrophosphatase [Undibacterium fentianense]|uniref:Pyrophosphatase n=1 Tax=Undibacterium fentianense TaxID=2828728 RepID=A0A941E3M9_9BURK|nr:pyrophosphatase [Undibacterium fentianense]MBR7801745.1 pyrophosphatase [Undibacterium fentianense]
MSVFSEHIKQFNGMYKLPVSVAPTLDVGVPAAERMAAFKDILIEEVHEIDEIIEAQKTGRDTVEVLTMLADLLGDIQVYCASEMAKFGLPLDEVLDIIMQSNLSKLGADGQPIYDERGKVMKGPNYWKPEPKLHAMLTERLEIQQGKK